MNPICVGFWKESVDMGWFPGKETWTAVPVANSATSDQSALLTKLARVEAIAQKTSYFGFSKCRICNAPNGCDEYSYNGFVWPSGYAHYLRDHAVACHPQFEAMIRAVNLNPL